MKKVTYIEAITQALYEEMERDERVFLIGQDIGLYGGVFKATKGLMDRFGAERVIDAPISEVYIAGGFTVRSRKKFPTTISLCPSARPRCARKARISRWSPTA